MTVITSLKAPEGINLATAWVPPDRPCRQSYAAAWKQFAPKLKNSWDDSLCEGSWGALRG